MNNIDKRYQELLQDILDNGVEKKDRTGTGTISVFGRQIRHKMSEGFPLLTTKKMAWKTLVTELLWFLRGDTNIKFLLDYDCHIWDGDAYKNYTKYASSVVEGYMNGDIVGTQPHIEKLFSNPDDLTILTKEEFIKSIKTDSEFAKQWGDLGPIYGKQWRNWMGFHEGQHDILKVVNGVEQHKDYLVGKDQIWNLINDLKTNPDSRRLMVSAWNVGELDKMTLPPCHYGFQVYTRELSREERIENYNSKFENKIEVPFIKLNLGDAIENTIDMALSQVNIPTRAISLMWNQRSVDTFLGLPFNIASYALLLTILAKEVNMIPDELIGNLGDTHLYLNHIEQAKEQIEREAFDLPTLNHLKEDSFYKSLSENQSLYSHLDNTDFELVNYQSHPTIKAPLSN
jgi:thymidylate synthase